MIMLHHRITRKELFQAQLALIVAIGLQIFTRHIGSELLPGSQYMIILTEVGLVVLLGFTVNLHHKRARDIHHAMAVVLVYVLHSLIVEHSVISGEKLLAAALAIFMTNIIVYALWYWEIDSPGLTRTVWSKYDKDFQFTQYDSPQEFPNWQPQFGDYLYLSVTNAVNFAPSDSRPLTLQAKFLMGSQALVAVFTLALVLARSVSILGS
jgi:uncharacterized membrane protein YhaH (DUF805 family)